MTALERFTYDVITLFFEFFLSKIVFFSILKSIFPRNEVIYKIFMKQDTRNFLKFRFKVNFSYPSKIIVDEN